MTDNRLVYDYLSLNGLTHEQLFINGLKLKPTKIAEIAREAFKHINSVSKISNSEFDLMANSKLSGEPDTCSQLDVRLQNIDILLRNTLLYADRIWIKNPLDKYHDCSEENFTIEENRFQFLYDIFILYQFRPLIESGIVIVCKTSTHYCRHCLIESSEKTPLGYKKKLDALEDYLMYAFKKDASYNIRVVDGQDVIEINAKNDRLFPVNPLYIQYSVLPDIFLKAKERSSKKIYQRELVDSDLVCSFINPILDDLVMHDWYANTFNLNYFTDRQIDKELIKILSNSEVNQKSEKFNNTLTHTLPIINNVPLEKIIELREGEPEAFFHYRNSMDRFLKEIKANEYSEKELVEAFKDEVQKSIDMINVTVRSSKEKLMKGTIVSSVLGLGLLSFGLAQGLIPIGIASCLSFFANSNHGAKSINDLTSLLGKDDSIRKERYYFLWNLMK